jgi:hypothetical protein
LGYYRVFNFILWVLYTSPFAPSISYFLNFKLPIERRP